MGLAGAALAGSQYDPQHGVYGVTENGPHGSQGRPHHNPNPPHDLRCERGLYGETRCNISPNGRTFGPEAFDYAVGTGQHIQR